MISEWKRWLPKSMGDTVAVLIFVYMVHSICLFELIVILPSIHEEYNLGFFLMVSFGFFLYFNVMVSAYLTITKNTTTVGIILPSVLKPGWRFCSTCEANSPPRSFHCWTCDVCVLRRDHHCVFTGNCVGLFNMRYYILMVLNLSIGALYCNFLNMDYIWDLFGDLSLKSVVTMIVPLVSWMFGLAEMFSFTIAIVSSSCMFGFILLLVLLCYHMNNILHGQTTPESSHRIKDYDFGWHENIREIFGVKWYIGWLCPLIPSPLPGNGLEFNKRTRYEDVKDM